MIDLSQKTAREIEGSTPDIGYEIKEILNMSQQLIIEGALFIGDHNPIHIDPGHPDTQRFGGVVASGSHVTAIFSALLPSDFIKYGPMLGAHMDVKFTAPVLPETDYFMSWIVESKEYKQSLRGTVYNMIGTVLSGNNKVVVRANASIILY